MNALELVGANNFVYREVPDPTISEDEVLINVRAVGICGSDVHGADGSTGRRIPPVIMGHEASGDVVSIGGRVEGFSIGDRVTFDSTKYCGNCFYCRRGEVNFCDRRRVFGVSADEYRQNGAFADYIAVPARGLFVIPEAVNYEHAAMVEPLSIALHAAEITPHTIGDSALVVGAGVIGLLLVQVLRQSGYSTVVSVDIDDWKLSKATELGATNVANPAKQDLASIINAVSNGRGVHNAFDAVGIQASYDAAIRAVRRGGTVTLIGNLSPQIEVPLQFVVTRQIRMQGSNASSGEYPASLELIRTGAINLDALISDVAPLSDGAEWFRRLGMKNAGLLKVILKP